MRSIDNMAASGMQKGLSGDSKASTSVTWGGVNTETGVAAGTGEGDGVASCEGQLGPEDRVEVVEGFSIEGRVDSGHILGLEDRVGVEEVFEDEARVDDEGEDKMESCESCKLIGAVTLLGSTLPSRRIFHL